MRIKSREDAEKDAIKHPRKVQFKMKSILKLLFSHSHFWHLTLKLSYIIYSVASFSPYYNCITYPHTGRNRGCLFSRNGKRPYSEGSRSRSHVFLYIILLPAVDVFWTWNSGWPEIWFSFFFFNSTILQIKIMLLLGHRNHRVVYESSSWFDLIHSIVRIENVAERLKIPWQN